MIRCSSPVGSFFISAVGWDSKDPRWGTEALRLDFNFPCNYVWHWYRTPEEEEPRQVERKKNTCIYLKKRCPWDRHKASARGRSLQRQQGAKQVWRIPLDMHPARNVLRQLSVCAQMSKKKRKKTWFKKFWAENSTNSNCKNSTACLH